MNQISKFYSNFSESEDFFSDLYELIRNNKWISIYFNGQKYFFFAWKGKILHLSEFHLSLILSTVAFVGTIGVRKLSKRIKLRKKMFRLIKKMRGGQSALELVDENDILHYEDELPDVLNYNPISVSSPILSSKQRFIKSIIKKCLKPGHIYKINHRGVLEILDKMIHFKKSDAVKIISYDVLVLSLIIALTPISRITYQGTGEIIKRIGTPFALEHLPLISAILTSVGFASRISLNAGFYELTLNLVFILIKSTGTFRMAELVRSKYFIDCTDYVKELPQANLKELPSAEISPELDSSSSSSSKISYTKEEPTRHDAFVSTSPNQQLHYREETKVETLDGQIRRVNQLKGKTIDYVEDRKPTELLEPSYIPLDQRTRTLADDVKSLDSTMDRESTGEITKNILEEQIKASLIRESLNGE
jgi:hypothetical protein